MVKEAQELTGKLGHLAKGANWIFHLLTHLYASIAYAHSKNKRFLEDSSPEFQTLIKSLRSGYFFRNVKDQIRHISFAIVGTLENGYIRNVPLPRIPQIQSTSQVASALTSRESHITCYSRIAWNPTWSELSCSPEGFGTIPIVPFFPLVG